VQLQIDSDPPGIQLSAGETAQEAPFPLTAIEGSNVLLSAPANAEIGGVPYVWKEWSDAGARVHVVKANAAATYTAVYAVESGEEPGEEPGEGEEGEGGGEPTKPEPPRPSSPQPLAEITPPLMPLPQTLLHGHPSKRQGATTARFAFSADRPGVRFRCKLDDRPFQPCRSPRVYRHLAPGGHAFRVIAIGPEGQADPTPSVFRWQVLPAGPS
jgi:hypothetical protein